MSASTELGNRLRSGAVRREQTLRRCPAISRPASNAQQRLWFLTHLGGGLATYSVPQSYRVKGVLCLERLDTGLTAIVARHEAIRTALVEREGALWQEVRQPMPIQTEQFEADCLDAARRCTHEAVARAFDLGNPPLLRAIWVRYGTDQGVLTFVFHHGAFDAWSLGVFYRELSALYGDAPAGWKLREPEFQYGDYADWQREWLASPPADRERQYWRRQFAGELPVLQLNWTSSSMPRGYSGGAVHFDLGPGVMDDVHAAANARQTTTFVILLSAFVATLYRYSLQEEIVVGVPAACRSSAETEGIIGYLANTIALRSVLSGGMRVDALIRHISQTFFEGLAHQELPFDQAIESIGLPRDAASNPVFQAMFVMQNTPVDSPLRLDDAEIRTAPVHTGTSKLDVTCSLRNTPAGAEGELEYSRNSWNERQASRFTETFANLLADLSRRPGARLDELSMLSGDDASTIIRAANSNVENYPYLSPVHAHFEAQAQRTPDRIAVETRTGSIDYASLNARANGLARRLREKGAGPETLIGVCMDRSIDMVTALLGILKAGAAFIPMDPAFPPERLRQICEDAQPLVVLTDERYLPKLAGISPVAAVESYTEAGDSDEQSSQAVSPENTAYAYYTSGSTGSPKGVVIEHRCAMKRLEWLRHRYVFATDDRVIWKTPLIFDVAIWEIFGPLISGATILMADAGAEADEAQIGDLLAGRHTVFAHFVPSVLEAYLNAAPTRSYPALRWVQLSGEAVPRRLAERFAGHFDAELHNCYGQTETAEVAALENAASSSGPTVPIGRQIGAYRVYILDNGLRPVPCDVPGEICVAGEGGLARGYRLRPDLTAEKFVPNPYATIAGERLYRTGDLGRIAETGEMEYLGRIDGQIKIAGCRIETAEVESVLSRHHSVKACAVIARPDASGANQLVAYIVSPQGAIRELAEYAEGLLPRYMLPAAYVVVAELPLSGSGKLDRLGLPAPAASDFALRGSHEAPKTPLESELAIMWEEILRLDRVGRDDNFFIIGGNSLKSMQVLVRVRARFGIRITVQEFFAAPTVAGLAKLTEQRLIEMVRSLPDVEARRLLQELRP